MGAGTFSTSSFVAYSNSLGRAYDADTGRVSGQEYVATRIDETLDPKKFTIRECCNSDEHPNTIPVILALDVTGSMGEACSEVASALGVIIKNLYEKFSDIEFCVMGIGDLAYDDAPIQMSQFESDIRIAESLDKIYMEHGGGGNEYESYTAAWYMGLKHTKLDCFEKQGRKGIIITMGDEPLNPYLPYKKLNQVINGTEQKDVKTNDLYSQVCEMYNVFHIAVDSPKNSYKYHKHDIENTFGQLLGANFKTSTVNNLAQVIEDCITESVGTTSVSKSETMINENGEIAW